MPDLKEEKKDLMDGGQPLQRIRVLFLIDYFLLICYFS